MECCQSWKHWLSLRWAWVHWISLRLSMNYGKSAKQVTLASVGVVLFSSALYPIWGLQFGSEATIRYRLPGEISLKYYIGVRILYPP